MAGQRSTVDGLRHANPIRLFTWAAGGAIANYDWGTVDDYYRVVDVWMINTSVGAGACTMTVSNTGNAITNAMDSNVADNTRTGAGTINDANALLKPGATLRCASSAALNTVLVCVLAELYSA